ncbi:hypothetical protein CCHR01_10290 [Colletotrichum chrysophilum]|uniref:Uncharacterized protein n=1 Tax=Colletotrichum chrysophilum TaxID=1836956 RepID=A0AAD9EGX2_9PEZI|nr:hypothetical protein CCHR01_10290 [Colletotrichum chrysophilum]
MRSQMRSRGSILFVFSARTWSLTTVPRLSRPVSLPLPRVPSLYLMDTYMVGHDQSWKAPRGPSLRLSSASGLR